MTSKTEMLTRAQAAKYLNVSVSWLQSHIADGPTVTRLGRKVLYQQADLDAYIASRRGRGMTQLVARREARKVEKSKAPTRAAKAPTRAVKTPTKSSAAASRPAAAAPTRAVTRGSAVAAPTRSAKSPTGASKIRTPSGEHKAGAVSRPVGTSVLQQLLESVRDMAPIGKAISTAKPPPLPARKNAPPQRPEVAARPPALPSRPPRRP